MWTHSPSRILFGRTEVIDNTLNPNFVRKFFLDFFFEEKQNLRFDVYNVDSRSSNISKFQSWTNVVSKPSSHVNHSLIQPFPLYQNLRTSWVRPSALWGRSLDPLAGGWRTAYLGFLGRS
uniref:C2 domain-containing protein n=1 Tax=Hucho hucho TaxID=62062 RepID=A0A4W5N4X2_9TELE